jgi:hypothetical protein
LLAVKLDEDYVIHISEYNTPRPHPQRKHGVAPVKRVRRINYTTSVWELIVLLLGIYLMP